MGTSPADSFVVGQLVLATCVDTAITFCCSIAYELTSCKHSTAQCQAFQFHACLRSDGRACNIIATEQYLLCT